MNLMKTGIKSNLFWGLGLSLILLLASSTASYISITNLVNSSTLVKSSNDIIDNLDAILASLKDAETGQRGFLITGNPVFLEPYNSSRAKTSEFLNAISAKLGTDILQQKNLQLLRDDIEKRMATLELNLKEKKEKGTVNTEQLMNGKNYMDDVRAITATIKKQELDLLQQRTEKLNSLAAITPVIIVITALLAIGITLFFYKRVSSDFNEKTSLQESLSKQHDETQAKIAAIEEVAGQISSGDYQIRLDKTSEDALGNLSGSLNIMAESLQNSFNLLEEKEWMQSAVAVLNNRMVGNKPIGVLSSDILETLMEYTQSSVGALYLIQENGEVRLTGSYALDSKEKQLTISPGEGIAGQCVKSGKTIVLQDITDSKHTISYATGRTKAKSVAAVPVIRDDDIIGVIETGSVQNYTPMQVDFMKNISRNVGIALSAAQSRKRLQELLAETQAQSEELLAQHEEMENMNAEMEAQNHKLQASEEELRVQQEELSQSNQELEERTNILEEKNQLIEERNLEILQKARQIEQSSKYKSEFLANMSHELRTPLNSILLLSRLMVDSIELDKEYVEYANVINNSGQGLLGLIDEILDLSKIESGKITLELTDVALQQIRDDINDLFVPLAKSKNLEFNITVDKNTVPVLHTDKMRLEQIIRNLLSNALKFTNEGKVSLHIFNAEDNQIVFSVADTGIGIPRDKQDLIFEAFQQADGSTRRRFGGTGLGLSISRDLAKILGGHIKLESEEGSGSTFSLTLPVNLKNIAAQPLTEQVSANVEIVVPPLVDQPKRFLSSQIPNPVKDDRDTISTGDKVILIVEDDTPFAEILLDFTRKRNYKGIVSVRGDEAVEIAEHFKPGAILLDIQLPIMDGWQVMEALKNNPATRPIPVHIMSSMKFKRESLLKGAVDFIDKPIVFEQMQQIFKKLEEASNKHLKKVLIVEENQQHAEALSYYLGEHNINTQIAGNIQESIDALQKHELDCVILDMGIPAKNSYDTLEAIKQKAGLENLPIIVFTGKSLSISEENRLKKYADSIVVKTAYSYQRILDEAGLFLHLVEEKNKKFTELTVGVRENIAAMSNVLKGKTALVADDDVRNIFSLSKALELHEMKVLPAVDGKEALAVLENNPAIDVVLVDMMMPELDGYETIREIRSKNKYKNIPILAVTAKAMMGDREKCIAVGASDYISKPVDIDQLISLLRVWLYDKI